AASRFCLDAQPRRFLFRRAPHGLPHRPRPKRAHHRETRSQETRRSLPRGLTLRRSVLVGATFRGGPLFRPATPSSPPLRNQPLTTVNGLYPPRPLLPRLHRQTQIPKSRLTSPPHHRVIANGAGRLFLFLPFL